MKYKDLIRNIDLVYGHLYTGRLKDAMNALAMLANQCQNRDLKSQLDNHLDTYRNMLKYSFELTDDPEKEKVYTRLLKALTGLADDIKEDLILNNNLLSYSNIKKQTQPEAEHIETISNEYIQQLNRKREMKELLEESGDKAGTVPVSEDRKTI